MPDRLISRGAAHNLDSIQDAVGALADETRSGETRLDLGPSHLVLSVGSHFFVFRETDEIFVARILYQSRDLVRHLGAGRP